MSFRKSFFAVLGRVVPSTWLGWGLFWFLQVLVIVAVGAVLGSVSYPLFGTVLGLDLSFQQFVLNGIKDGGFYALIWAPGVSLVSSIMAAHWKLNLRERNSGKSLDTQN